MLLWCITFKSSFEGFNKRNSSIQFLICKFIFYMNFNKTFIVNIDFSSNVCKYLSYIYAKVENRYGALCKTKIFGKIDRCVDFLQVMSLTRVKLEWGYSYWNPKNLNKFKSKQKEEIFLLKAIIHVFLILSYTILILYWTYGLDRRCPDTRL